jgi:hypothetical protein
MGVETKNRVPIFSPLSPRLGAPSSSTELDLFIAFPLKFHTRKLELREII